jgi:hypothetical protein
MNDMYFYLHPKKRCKQSARRSRGLGTSIVYWQILPKTNYYVLQEYFPVQQHLKKPS